MMKFFEEKTRERSMGHFNHRNDAARNEGPLGFFEEGRYVRDVMEDMGQEQGAKGFLGKGKGASIDDTLGDISRDIGGKDARFEIFQIAAAAPQFDEHARRRGGAGVFEQALVPIVVISFEQRPLEDERLLQSKELRGAGGMGLEGGFF